VQDFFPAAGMADGRRGACNRSTAAFVSFYQYFMLVSNGLSGGRRE